MADRIVVTGANGFVGRHVVAAAAARGLKAVGVVRSPAGAAVVRAAGGEPLAVARLSSPELRRVAAGARAIVHLAQIGSEKPGVTYASVNVEGTRAVARAAAEAGGVRVVYFSGLGVARYGLSARSTNRYFLSKLEAEIELYRTGVPAVVFRPSYIIGPGDGLISGLLEGLANRVVEMASDGRYRLQPVAIKDATDAVLAVAGNAPEPVGRSPHRVVDLVGPGQISYADFVARVAAVQRERDRPSNFVVRHVSLEDADRQAAAGGWHGMLPDELDCLLCDEVADPAPLAALLHRPLIGLHEAITAAVDGTPLPK